jgi:hypothetical protein
MFLFGECSVHVVNILQMGYLGSAMWQIKFFGGSMALTSLSCSVGQLIISAIPGSAAGKVLDQLTRSNTERTEVFFPEPWVDNYRLGVIRKVRKKPTAIRLQLVRVQEPGQVQGVFLEDKAVPFYSTQGKVDTEKGIYRLPINHKISAQQDIDRAARNILAVLGACTQFSLDSERRLYPDPHGLNSRPPKIARPWKRSGSTDPLDSVCLW